MNSVYIFKNKSARKKQCVARPRYQGEREVSFSSFISFVRSQRPRSHDTEGSIGLVVPPARRRSIPRFYDFQNQMRVPREFGLNKIYRR